MRPVSKCRLTSSEKRHRAVGMIRERRRTELHEGACCAVVSNLLAHVERFDTRGVRPLVDLSHSHALANLAVLPKVGAEDLGRQPNLYAA